jgi:hypothetical protein
MTRSQSQQSQSQSQVHVTLIAKNLWNAETDIFDTYVVPSESVSLFSQVCDANRVFVHQSHEIIDFVVWPC